MIDKGPLRSAIARIRKRDNALLGLSNLAIPMIGWRGSGWKYGGTMRFEHRNALLSGTAFLVLVAEASLVHAQATSSEQAVPVGDIVVTAQKRSERLSDVPLAVTAASGEQLVKQGITDTTQLTKLVPSLTYQISDYGTPIFTIRGVGFKDFSLGATPAVTTYIDQVPLPYSVLTRGATLDLERVEVLKGPQGTLFGQNSTGGAINYIAAKPTDSLHAGMTLGYSRFDRVEAEGFVSGPLGPTLSARIAVRHESQDGWQKSYTRNDTLGDANFNNARFLLDWKPSSAVRFELNVSGWHDRSETQAMQFEAFTPSNPNPQPINQQVFDAIANYPIAPRNDRAADWDAGSSYRRNDKFYLLSLHGDWDIAPDTTITSITSYSHYTTRSPFDVDGTDYPNLDIFKIGLLKSFSQELRLAGKFGALRYTLGANYQHEVADESDRDVFRATNVFVGPFYFPDGTLIDKQRVKTKSVFGDLRYALTDSLTAQISGRYSDQHRHFAGCYADYGDGASSAAFGAVTGTIVPPGSCVTISTTTFQSPPIITSNLNQDNVSWRANLSWKATADTLLYASVTKGYKAGSYSVPAAVLDTQLDPVTQESVIAYEAGLKTSFADRKAQLTGAVFYYDYKNKQLNGNVLNPLFGPQQQLINIPKSRVYGAEVELVLRPVEGLRFSGGVTYLNSRVQRDPVGPAQALDPLGGAGTYVGERFPNTPRWLGVADGEYDLPTSGSVRPFLGGTVTYRSQANASFGELALFRLPSYALLDLRAGVESVNEKWRVQVFGRNVTNRYYWVGVSRNIDTVSRFAGQPATYGVQLSYRY